jgi:MFS transporter, OPA family, glycerol-3-phosphate transporter
MFLFFKPPAPSTQYVAPEKLDETYTFLRWQVFLGIFVGYAGYYLVRKNFSLVMPDLIAQGYSKSDLGFALSGVSIAYGVSKFAMGMVSDKSNARVFLSLGLLLSGLTMVFMGLSPWATSSITIMFILLLLNGWFQGMGWPPSGRVMVHWFSQKERGRKMSIWNIAHNVGGGLVGPMATWAVILLGAWQSKFYFLGFVAVTIAFIAYVLVRDTPASCGLPVIEDYKKDYLELNDQEVSEKLKTSDIFLRYIWGNKLLWYIAFANIFIYLVRYGVLDWAPTYLKEVKGYSLEESGWAYFMYEYAGIPGTLLCGWMSDTLFKGKRSPATIMYMLFVLLAVVVYWKNPPGHFWIDQFALIAIGFFIYGPVMLIGVFALDLVPKNVAGTAAGFTGLFGYLGGSVFANIALGFILERWQWNGGFMVLVTACVLAILLMLPTWRQEIIHSKGLNLEK